MQKKVIAVLFGGVSPEHEVSKSSAAAVLNAIPTDKYVCVPVYVSKCGEWFMYDGSIDNFKNIRWEKHGTPVVLGRDKSGGGLLRIVSGRAKKIALDGVFPLIHGINGEDGSLQGVCRAAGLPCVGSGVAASVLCMDKSLARVIVADLKIPHTPGAVILPGDKKSDISRKTRYKTGYPCFVKPVNSGSSVGISKVGSKEELYEAINLAFEYDDKVLVEKAVLGRELECAVLGNENPAVSPVGEVISANEFYDYNAKYENAGSKTVVAPDLPDGAAKTVQEYSLRIFKALGCKGYARVDFFLENETGKIIFNEVNTIPGFTSASMFPMLMESAGYPLPELCDKLISLAFEESL